MKWFKESVMFLLILVIRADAKESASRKMKHELSALHEQLEILKSSYLNDILKLRKEFQEFKDAKQPCAEPTNKRNEKQTLEWARNSMAELRTEMRDMSKSINSSALLHQLHSMHNQLKRVVSEATDLLNLDRTQEARIDKLDSTVERLKYEKKETSKVLEQYRIDLSKLAKEVQAKQFPEADMSTDIIDEHLARSEAGPLHPQRHHKYRHNKMVHSQIARLAKAQVQVDTIQQNMQTKMLDLTRRIDRLEEPDWNLVTSKIDLLQLQAKVFSDRLNNNTMAVSDFEKVHASMLELREDVESLEDKFDKTIPEFRKEISKLDVCVAQNNAHFSYVKEGQENLRQSVKAIAVSVSNALDRAEDDRDELKKVTNTVFNLEARTKQHIHRLNDHIQKTEANQPSHENVTQTVSLPELMGEVKELQPVEREYEDLVRQLPRDCFGVSGPAGVYLIHPGRAPLDAWCDNGSTLLQRRYNGTIEFNRKFSEYAAGFGNPASEFWLGLDTMHQLTADNCSSMRIDMTDIYGATWYAQYENFNVGSADSGYVLDVSGFKGNASNAFEYQNHMEFSAIDRDRDTSNTNCAGNYEGGWWYSHCQHVNINGKYTLGLTWFDGARNEWIAVATSEMKMYHRPGCL